MAQELLSKKLDRDTSGPVSTPPSPHGARQVTDPIHPFSAPSPPPAESSTGEPRLTSVPCTTVCRGLHTASRVHTHHHMNRGAGVPPSQHLLYHLVTLDAASLSLRSQKGVREKEPSATLENC